MIDLVKQQLTAMRQQEHAIAQEIERLNVQLHATQGAVQVLEHVLDTYEAGEGESAPALESEGVDNARS